MSDFKKRGQAGWETCKSILKSKCNRTERNYAKKEAREELEEYQTGNSSKVTGNRTRKDTAKRIRKAKKRDNAIAWYKRHIKKLTTPPHKDMCNDLANSFRHTLSVLEKEKAEAEASAK